MSKVVQLVYPLAENCAQKCNVEIMDIEYAKKNNGNNLTIFIYKNGGVDIQDCVALHKMIDGPLDELNPTNGEPYTLNVSSWSAGKPLKTEKEFDFAIGKDVEIKLFESFESNKNFTGVLTNVEKDFLRFVDNSGKEYKFDRAKIASISLYFKEEK